MYRSQQLALKYLTAAIALFGVMIIAGLLSACYYVHPDLLFGILHFNIAKILHIDTMIIWLLMGFTGQSTGFCRTNSGASLPALRPRKSCSTSSARQLRLWRSYSSLSNTAAATKPHYG